MPFHDVLKRSPVKHNRRVLLYTEFYVSNASLMSFGGQQPSVQISMSRLTKPTKGN